MCVRCGLNLNHESTYYVYIESLEVIRLEKLKYKSTYKNMADNYKITLQFSTGNRKKSFFFSLFGRRVSRFSIEHIFIIIF